MTTKRLRSSNKAFSLVEVVTAIGIAGVGLITVVTAMTQAVKLSSRSVHESKAANIAQQIASNLQLEKITTWNGKKGTVFEGKSINIKFPTFGPMFLYFDDHQQIIPKASDFGESTDAENNKVYASYKATVQGFAHENDSSYSKILIKVLSEGQNDQSSNNKKRAVPFFFVLKNPDA